MFDTSSVQKLQRQSFSLNADLSPVEQCFSTFVRPRTGNFFYKTRARSEQIYW